MPFFVQWSIYISDQYQIIKFIPHRPLSVPFQPLRLLMEKGVFSPIPPDHGCFVPSHSFITMLFTLFYHLNQFDVDLYITEKINICMKLAKIAF